MTIEPGSELALGNNAIFLESMADSPASIVEWPPFDLAGAAILTIVGLACGLFGQLKCDSARNYTVLLEAV